MIRAKLTQTIDFDLSNSEAKEIAIKYICARFDWGLSYFIRFDEKKQEEWVFDKEMAYSSHSFETESRLRKATDADRAIYKFLLQF